MLRVASGENEAETSNVNRALARPSSKQSSKPDGKRGTSSKYRTDELNEPAPRLQGIRSLLPLPGGDLLTGGTDLRIRYWDHSRLSFKFNTYNKWLHKINLPLWIFIFLFMILQS